MQSTSSSYTSSSSSSSSCQWLDQSSPCCSSGCHGDVTSQLVSHAISENDVSQLDTLTTDHTDHHWPPLTTDHTNHHWPHWQHWPRWTHWPLNTLPTLTTMTTLTTVLWWTPAWLDFGYIWPWPLTWLECSVRLICTVLGHGFIAAAAAAVAVVILIDTWFFYESRVRLYRGRERRRTACFLR